MDGGSGNDTMDGGDDADNMTGGTGNDSMDGGDDDDHLSGGQGADEMFGGEGNDCLKGGTENDTIWGDDGDDSDGPDDQNVDVILGGDGNDELHGEEGNDSIDGGNGDDELFGGAGNDQIVPREGNDTMYGGTGSDTFEFHQDDVNFNLFQNATDVIKDWDANNDLSDGDADVIKLCGQPEFVPVKIQFGVWFPDSGFYPDDVFILLSNGQRIFLEDAALVDYGTLEQEFEMGIATFTEGLAEKDLNRDDFEFCHLPQVCPELECDDPDTPDDLPPPEIW
jgi:hypothetical protein